MHRFTKKTTEFIEEKRQCPYDPAHQLIPIRFAGHLVKCRKNYLADQTSPYHKKALETEICPFDYGHHVHKSQMREHLETCSGRKLAKTRTDNSMAEEPAWKKNSRKQQMGNSQKTDQEEEDVDDWEKETQDSPYDPVARIRASEKHIIVNPQGLTKSQRRQFLANDRWRFNGDETFADPDEYWVPVISRSKPPPPLPKNPKKVKDEVWNDDDAEKSKATETKSSPEKEVEDWSDAEAEKSKATETKSSPEKEVEDWSDAEAENSKATETKSSPEKEIETNNEVWSNKAEKSKTETKSPEEDGKNALSNEDFPPLGSEHLIIPEIRPRGRGRARANRSPENDFPSLVKETESLTITNRERGRGRARTLVEGEATSKEEPRGVNKSRVIKPGMNLTGRGIGRGTRCGNNT